MRCCGIKEWHEPPVAAARYERCSQLAQMGYSAGMQVIPVRLPSCLVFVMARGLLLPLCLMFGSPVWALYKVVGPDGKVTYTDRAPVGQPSQQISRSGVVSETSALPYELRRVVQRYPVTLYTTEGCGPCDQARGLLKQRGVPFTEKLIKTSADEAELQRLENTRELPVGRIGVQQVLGFSAQEWQSYLDAAGYPAASVLPSGYAAANASPLTQPPVSNVTGKPRTQKTEPVSPSPLPASNNAVRF